MAKQLEPANILFEKHLSELGLMFKREYQFYLSRKWRFDYILIKDDGWTENIAIEIEGGIYSAGRHVRGKGYENDLEKYNTAAINGWRVLRFSTGQVMRGEAKKFLAEWMEK